MRSIGSYKQKWLSLHWDELMLSFPQPHCLLPVSEVLPRARQMPHGRETRKGWNDMNGYWLGCHTWPGRAGSGSGGARSHPGCGVRTVLLGPLSCSPESPHMLHLQPCLTFYMGAGNSNSGPLGFEAGSLSIERAPSPHFLMFNNGRGTLLLS